MPKNITMLDNYFKSQKLTLSKPISYYSGQSRRSTQKAALNQYHSYVLIHSLVTLIRDLFSSEPLKLCVGPITNEMSSMGRAGLDAAYYHIRTTQLIAFTTCPRDSF